MTTTLAQPTLPVQAQKSSSWDERDRNGENEKVCPVPVKRLDKRTGKFTYTVQPCMMLSCPKCGPKKRLADLRAFLARTKGAKLYIGWVPGTDRKARDAFRHRADAATDRQWAGIPVSTDGCRIGVATQPLGAEWVEATEDMLSRLFLVHRVPVHNMSRGKGWREPRGRGKKETSDLVKVDAPGATVDAAWRVAKKHRCIVLDDKFSDCAFYIPRGWDLQRLEQELLQAQRELDSLTRANE